MSDASYSTAFAHLVLAGSSVWTYRLINSGAIRNHQWAYGTLGLLFFNSCIGVMRFGHPNLVQQLRNAYEHIFFLSTSLALPCIGTELYLSHSYKFEVAVLHAASGIFPVLADLANNGSKGDLQNMVIALNCASLLYLGFIHENYYAIAVAISFGLDFFAVKNGNIGDVPPLDLFIIGLCFFNYFSYRALSF